ncbi:hypothetical protein F5B17DRAFT_125816 [Nemania serpens]|nr:hypothetical protein F5B17DRAFT_125816 [Nemania serpens]
MPVQVTMNLLALLTMPLAALAAPEATISRCFNAAPFAPGTPEQGSFDRCSTVTHHKGRLAHPANMLDCLEIGAWAKKNNGVWILHATTAAGAYGWYALRTQGTCALIVRNSEPTAVGNQDVADLIEAVHLGDGIALGPIEEVGYFGGCQGGVNVSFWLRSSEI